MPTQTAFGGMLQDVVAHEAIVLRPEPLGALIERRCKHAWEQAPCPECGEVDIQSGDDSPRLWCRNCRYVFTYTRNTPFQGRVLTPGEIVLAFILYADTLLSIHQIAQLFDPVYNTIHTTLRESEAAFERGYAPLVFDTERVVNHSEEFVTDDGVHVNQVECLWSLVNPWLQKFRGLSKPGVEQSVRTYGFVRSPNLAGAPLHSLIDCFAVNVFHQVG